MKKITLMAAFLLTGLALVQAQHGNLNLGKSGLAIEGYDPVAYLTTGKAVEGKSSIALAYNGATYRFASAANLDLFKSSPGKYLPQYGG